MKDKEILDFCRFLVREGLQYRIPANVRYFGEELNNLEHDSDNSVLLRNCVGLKEVLTDCINIISKGGDKNG